MRKIAFLLLFLFPATTLAQAAPCTAQVYGDFVKELNWNCPVPNEDAMVPKLEVNNDSVSLTKGAPAPFAGILMDQNRVMMLGLRITGLRRLLWIELKTAKAQQDLAVARAIELSKKDAKSVEAQNQALTARNAQLTSDLKTEKSWYRSWTFGFVLGTLITSAAAISLAVATH